jgi:hypothetical protein
MLVAGDYAATVLEEDVVGGEFVSRVETMFWQMHQ